MNEKPQNLQDTFLNSVRKSKTSVTIYLVNGVNVVRLFSPNGLTNAIIWNINASGATTVDDIGNQRAVDLVNEFIAQVGFDDFE